MVRGLAVVAITASLSVAGASADTPRLPNPAVASGQAASGPAYIDGRRDRKAWEDWFNGLAIGSYRDGALWWFSERTKQFPRGCVSPSGNAGWLAGCKAAQQRLALCDVRWKTESLYALGWASEVEADIPPEPITMSETERLALSAPAYADGRRDWQAIEDWLKRLPTGAYRDGAFWWLDEHDKNRPEACVSPAEDTQWEAGCRAAQGRLAVPDVRRTTEVDYRMGWNSRTGAGTP